MPYPSYGGDGPLLLGVTWSLCTLAGIFVALRAWVARTLGGKLRWDFIWITVAYIIAFAAQVLMTVSILHGIGNHVDAIRSQRDSKIAALFNWMFQMITIVDIVFVKMAIVALILSIQGNTHRKGRYFLHFIWISNLILSINQDIMIILECKPIPKFWDFTIQGVCNYRERDDKLGWLQGGWGAASDLALAIYPVFIYWPLKLSLRMRLGLCTLTGGGVIVAAAAVMKTIYIAVIKNSEDPTYAFTNLIIWASVELWLIMVLSSIPPLRSLFAEFFGSTANVLSQSLSHSRSRQYGTGTGTAMSWPEIELGSKPTHSGTSQTRSGHSMFKNGGRATATMFDDGDSQEGILPNKDEIWITRQTIVERGMETLEGRRDPQRPGDVYHKPT